MADETPDTLVRFKIEGSEYELDLDDLEIGEVVEIEKFLDKPMTEIFNERWQASASVTVILAYVAKRRVEPLTTLDQVLALKRIEVLGDRPTATRETNGRSRSTKSRASSRGKSDD